MTEQKAFKYLKVLLFLTFLVRLYHINYPVLDHHMFRQAHTASVIRNFDKTGIDLLCTKLDVFGIGKEKVLLLEFPLYEAIVALAYKVFGPYEVLARLVSIFFGLLGAFYLFLIVKRLYNPEIALLSSFFFLVSPLNIYFQRSIMIEPTVVALGLMMLYYSIGWIDDFNSKDYIIAIVTASLAFMHKGNLYTFYAIAALYYLSRNGIRELFRLRAIVAMLIPVLLLLLWQGYTEHVNIANGHSYFSLSNTPSYITWNFGTLRDRLDITCWKQVFDIFVNETVGVYQIAFFALGFMFYPGKKAGWFFHVFIFSMFLNIFIFFGRIRYHDYYHCALVPAASFFTAYGFFFVLNKLKSIASGAFVKREELRLSMPILLLTLCFLFTITNFISARHLLDIDENILESSKVVSENTKKRPAIIAVSPWEGWNPAFFYAYNKEGLQVKHKGLLENKIETVLDSTTTLEELERKGYKDLLVQNYTRLMGTSREMGCFPYKYERIPYKLTAQSPNIQIYDMEKKIDSTPVLTQKWLPSMDFVNVNASSYELDDQKKSLHAAVFIPSDISLELSQLNINRSANTFLVMTSSSIKCKNVELQIKLGGSEGWVASTHSFYTGSANMYETIFNVAPISRRAPDIEKLKIIFRSENVPFDVDIYSLKLYSALRG